MSKEGKRETHAESPRVRPISLSSGRVQSNHSVEVDRGEGVDGYGDEAEKKGGRSE